MLPQPEGRGHVPGTPPVGHGARGGPQGPPAPGPPAPQGPITDPEPYEKKQILFGIAPWMIRESEKMIPFHSRLESKLAKIERIEMIKILLPPIIMLAFTLGAFVFGLLVR
mgnify:CR=1 FL=1